MPATPLHSSWSVRCLRLRAALAAAALGLACTGALAQPRPAPDPWQQAQEMQQAGDAASALKLAEAALAQSARDARWRFLKGVLLADLGRAPEALEVFTRLSEDYPELADPLNNIGVIRAAQGRLDDARVALEAAVRNDPRHRQARENLGDVYIRLAIRLWEALAQGPAADAGLARKLALARELAALR
jgi:tetratricopeptide (TPR) repeat protein